MRHDNNFDSLRLVLAWMVVGAHCADLSGNQALHVIGWFANSKAAVEGFFAISGCLIVASWERSKSLVDYFRRRAQRILPGYWLALGLCLVVGSFMTSLSLAAFWRSRDTWQYIFYNLLFLNFKKPDLPGVFQHNFLTPAMNGALWTIKLEIGFYILVPFLAWFVRKINPLVVVSTTFLLSIAFNLLFEHLGKPTLGKQLPGQLCFFMVGTAVYYYFNQFQAHKQWMWTLALVATITAALTGWLFLEAIGVPLLVLCIAFLLPSYRGITRFGDFSYGTYVLHFPIVQTLVALGFFSRTPFGAVSLVVLIVAILSVLSWFGVERVFLRPTRVQQQESEARKRRVDKIDQPELARR